MKQILILIMSITIAQMAPAQVYLPTIPELHQKLVAAKEDTAKCMLLIRMAELYSSHGMPDSSLQASAAAKELAVRLGFYKGIALAGSATGIVYEVNKTDYASAIIYYRQAVQLSEEKKMYDDIYLLHSRLLNLYFYLDNFPDAMTVVTNGLRIYGALNDQRKLAKYVSLAGYIYLKQNSTEKAKQYYQQYLQLATSIGDSGLLAEAHGYMADVYILTKDSQLALKELAASLNIYTRLGNKDRVAYLYCETGRTYLQMQNYQQALTCLLRTFANTDEARTNRYELANYYITLGNIYVELAAYEKAFRPLHTGLGIAKEIHHREDMLNGYEYLSKLFVKKHQYDSAFMYNTLYHNLKDSISTENAAREVEQVHTAFEVEKKDREIALLSQQQRADTAEISRQHAMRNIFIVSFLLVAVIVALLFNRQKLQQQRNLQVQLNDHRNEMFNTVMVAQDKERKRIAEDIHDGLGSILSAAKLQLSDVETNIGSLDENQLSRYRNTLQLLDEASAELRNISHHIMPATLGRLGLVAALQNLFDKISLGQQLQISFITHGFEGRLPEEMELSIYQVILEAVNNILKHAAASQATIQLVQYPAYINIVIEDNGGGFEYDAVKAELSGMGLQNMVSRVSYLKGSIHIDAEPGRGTSILIDIPYQAYQ